MRSRRSASNSRLGRRSGLVGADFALINEFASALGRLKYAVGSTQAGDQRQQGEYSANGSGANQSQGNDREPGGNSHNGASPFAPFRVLPHQRAHLLGQGTK